MEGIFTLPYSEYEVINQLKKKLSKNDGNSCYIPISRQQKGIDFIIHNNKTKKILRFQVKSSRSYSDEPKKSKLVKDAEIKYTHHLWFINFIDRYEKGNADYYILFGLYPIYQQKKNIKLSPWKSLLLCFSEDEMKFILEKVKTKKEKKKDRFFGIKFYPDMEVTKIFGTRGFDKEIDLSKFLIENKLKELREKLK